MTEEEMFHQDRRVEHVTVKVAMLEERSLAAAAAMSSLKEMMTEHIRDQKKWQDDHAAEEKSNWDKTQTILSEIQNKLNNNKGFVAGAIFIISAIWALIVVIKDNFMRMFH